MIHQSAYVASALKYVDVLKQPSPMPADSSQTAIGIVAGQRPLLVTGYVGFSITQLTDESIVIGEFPGEPYAVKTPIPVVVEWTGADFVARFEEANIAMSGNTRSEALGNLAATILDTLEDYSSEPTLGPGPAHQLAVLRQYIAER